MVAIIAALAIVAAPQGADSLQKPFVVMAGNDPINVDTGHAAPYVVDWNKDGKKDLLVGQFDGGKMRIYLNRGSNNKPSFKDFTYFQAGGELATVDYG